MNEIIEVKNRRMKGLFLWADARLACAYALENQ
jgi:hypothetical protein